MGMRQRLGLAGTLLGDPRVLILDEPANGLDPEGIRWLRGFFRHLAGEGRTVLVSSHQLAEVQEVADRAVILNRGKLVRAGTLAELSAGNTTAVVRGPNLAPLQQALAAAGLSGSTEADGSLRVHTEELTQIGHLAFVHNVELHELSLERFDLEKLFFCLTEGEHQGADLDCRSRHGADPNRPPTAEGGPLMLNLIRSEVLKTRSTQVWLWMILPAAALTALSSIGRATTWCSSTTTATWTRSTTTACSPPGRGRGGPAGDRRPRPDHRVPAQDHHADPAGDPEPVAPAERQGHRLRAVRAVLRDRVPDRELRDRADLAECQNVPVDFGHGVVPGIIKAFVSLVADRGVRAGPRRPGAQPGGGDGHRHLLLHRSSTPCSTSSRGSGRVYRFTPGGRPESVHLQRPSRGRPSPTSTCSRRCPAAAVPAGLDGCVLLAGGFASLQRDIS